MSNKSILLIPQPKLDAGIRLICFPYAGGNASLFFPWLDQLTDDVEVALLQLPGRGARFSESPYEAMADIVGDVYVALRDLSPRTLIFFGHSMGARIAYEVILRLHQQNEMLPIHFIASASPGPCVERKKAPSYNLSTQAFIEHLGELKGTPKEVLDDPQLMELLLPTLRADFKIVETYLNTQPVRLPTTITVFSGRHDDVATADLESWFSLFEYNHGIVWFEGGHFFINESRSDIIAAVRSNLAHYLKLLTT